METYISSATMEISKKGPQETKNRTGIHPKECKSAQNRDTCTLMLILALTTIDKGLA
jgi:hypothetical protein